MKIIVTTSNSYIHLIPVFTYLFNKAWGAQCEIVGYNTPAELPANFTFHSLGKQEGGPENFTRDLRGYFAQQERYFIWLMEDCFVKEMSTETLRIITDFLPHISDKIGRFNLTGECVKQDHCRYGNLVYPLYANTPTASYRLSTQPSIWNRDFLLQYMQQDMSPWTFEKQDTKDDYAVLGFGKEDAPLRCNEGVRKRDLFAFDLAGFPQEDLDYINNLK